MREGEKKRRVLWFGCCRKQRRTQHGSYFINGLGCGAHWPPKLRGLKTPFCGFWVRSTKKRKSLVEKPSFIKNIFFTDSKTLKIVHRFWCEKSILPFFAEKRSFWVSNMDGENIKVVGSSMTNQET